tara:strand:+ start:493 stop:1404 length:912 start_codon:yes stop_codon:yes gene_type:complete
MIFTTTPTGVQMNLNSWTCSTESDVITLNKEADLKDFCLCDYECKYNELAFADVGSVDDNYKNDYRKFLLNPKSVNAIYEFLLVGSDGEETVIDSTLGDVYAQGFNTEQPLQVGVNVLWVKVAEVLGYGDYTIKINLEEFGSTITTESHKFSCVRFDTDRADNTVKIEVVNQGITMNGVNWDGLGQFINMVRVEGRLNETDPEIEKESFVTTSRETVSNQITKIKTFNLSILDIPSGIGDGLIDEGSLMNWIVTDYNVFNYKDYRNLVLEVDSTPFTDMPGYTRRDFEVSLKETKFKLNRKFV